MTRMWTDKTFERVACGQTRRFVFRGLVLVVAIGVLTQVACSSRWESVGEGASLDVESIHQDHRIPAVDRNNKPLAGVVYAATLRMTQSPDLVPYSPDDPEAKKNPFAWDDRLVDYFFYCGDPILMSLDSGEAHNFLRGKPMLSENGEEDRKSRMLIDYTSLESEEYTFPTTAVKAGKIVCRHAAAIAP